MLSYCFIIIFDIHFCKKTLLISDIQIMMCFTIERETKQENDHLTSPKIVNSKWLMFQILNQN